MAPAIRAMATDLGQVVRNLVAFYAFAGRTVVAVGAGGGQLAEYSRQARRVIAVDPDGGAIERLATRLADLGLADRLTIVQADLLAVRPRGDVVLFEFCLHEMSEPIAPRRRSRYGCLPAGAALRLARRADLNSRLNVP